MADLSVSAPAAAATISDRVGLPLGAPIPLSAGRYANTVSLSTIDAVRGYEEKDPCVLGALQAGYQRFFSIAAQELCRRFSNRLNEGEDLLVLPSLKTATRCIEFIQQRGGRGRVESGPQNVGLAIFPAKCAAAAKSFWQHTGLIVSTRQAEALLKGVTEVHAADIFDKLKQRIAGLYGFASEDVYLSPSGMAAFFELHAAIKATCGAKTLQVGYPYGDLLSVQEKFGEGFYMPYKRPRDLARVKEFVDKGGVSAVVVEIPGNPELITVDLPELKGILDGYGVPLIVDNTVGAADVDVRPYADAVVTSLTKNFSGKNDVLGGSFWLSPMSPYYEAWKEKLASREQLLYPADAGKLLHNAEDYEKRVSAANRNALILFEFLRKHPAVDKVYYTLGDPAYEKIRKQGGGYGTIISFTLKDPSMMAEVYDHLHLAKGASFGWEGTLVTPQILLMHYNELGRIQDLAGFPPDLFRLSVGTEKIEEILLPLGGALDRAASPSPGASRTIFLPKGVRVEHRQIDSPEFV